MKIIIGKITYARKRQIGAGQGMNSVVWLAHDSQLGGQIVVKEIPKKNLGNDINTYFSEAKTMFAVDNKHVVPIRAAFQTDDLVCLAMDYYKNGSLYDRIVASPLGLKELLRVGQGVLAGVAHIHARGYIHFDIKPSNVLFSNYHIPMVADFGQTRKTNADGMVIPRPPLYPVGIPPECYDGFGTHQSDIYHVGLTLYRAANGKQFFQDQVPSGVPDDERAAIIKRNTRSGKFPNRSSFLPHIPKRLRTVIRKALTVDPADRYQNAGEFSYALGGVNPTHDWNTIISPTGEITWRAERNEQPTLVVCLVRSGKRWAVQSFTERDGRRRKRARSEWKDGITFTQATRCLKTLFESME